MSLHEHVNSKLHGVLRFVLNTPQSIGSGLMKEKYDLAWYNLCSTFSTAAQVQITGIESITISVITLGDQHQREFMKFPGQQRIGMSTFYM